MQYPIIDLITSAYINNGWTGLELTEGKNLFNETDYLNLPTNYDFTDSGYAIKRIQLTPETTYTVSNNTNVDNNSIILLINAFSHVNEQGFWDGRRSNEQKTFTTSNDGLLYIGALNATNATNATNETYNNRLIQSKIQIENGTSKTEYEPYHVPDTDIANRLKLPLPHYFPYPVIDSLKRASEGTMTNKDREILRHYLTPIGIGGI